MVLAGDDVHVESYAYCFYCIPLNKYTCMCAMFFCVMPTPYVLWRSGCLSGGDQKESEAWRCHRTAQQVRRVLVPHESLVISSIILYIYIKACVYTHKIYLLYMTCACSHTFLDLCLQVILIYMCLLSRYTYGRFLNTSTTIYGLQIWYLLSTTENWINGSLSLYIYTCI